MTQANQGNPSHFGAVTLKNGEYVRVAGTTNWVVHPIEAFDPPIRVPVGLIRIDFDEPISEPYTILVTAGRILNTPLVAANYGDVDENGFVVYMWETIADRTVQNADFSFAVYQNPA